MKIPVFFLATVLASPLLQAELPPVPTAPATPASALLDACPAPVRETIVKAAAAADGLAAGRVARVRAVRRGEQTLYIATIDREQDRDLKLQVRADGSVAKRIEDLPISAAPEPVRQSLAALAGPDGGIDDVKKITEGDTVVFKAEIERATGPDLDVKAGPDGTILEQTEDLED